MTRTLRNAIRQQRVAHAYLFTGPRGTGKTSTARILAKAVNCLDPQDGNPCNRCEACNAADEGRAIDVIEIDAASNTSVENVRDLRERVAYAAGEGRYKVYIVDEVHRLSGAAFDAFLKTLEEPPPHVIFVFASTEPQKVPATIASRCQRFDFRRIGAEEAFERLQYVAANEGLDVTEEALRLIALQADGSLRDALGLLDQVTSYAKATVDEPDVRASLGLADPTLIARLTDCLLDAQVGNGLAEATSFVDAGGDPTQLVRQLIDYWRALLLRVTKTPKRGMAMDPILEQKVAAHAARVSQAQVLDVLRSLTSQDFSSRYNVPASLPLEAGYVQAAVSLRTRRSPDETSSVPQPRKIEGHVVDSPAKPTRDLAKQPSNALTVDQSPPASTESPYPRGIQEPEINPSGPPEVVPTTVRPESTPQGFHDAWEAILENMREKSKSIRALLKDGYLMQVDGGEVTVGFLYDFHANQFADVTKRRLLERVVSDTLGSPHRVRCMRVTREEIEAARGAGIVVDDDGFVEEAAARIRDYHIKQLHNGGS